VASFKVLTVDSRQGIDFHHFADHNRRHSFRFKKGGARQPCPK
jgi:hypothetical protein